MRRIVATAPPILTLRKLLLFGAVICLSGCNTVGYGGGDYEYHDVRKPHGKARGDAALQADTRLCDRQTGGQQAYGTPPFNRCMRARGWSFAAYTPAVDNSAPDDNSAELAAEAEQRDDDARRNDESNRQTQQSIDDMNRTQDMINQQQMLANQQMIIDQQNMINNQ